MTYQHTLIPCDPRKIAYSLSSLITARRNPAMANIQGRGGRDGEEEVGKLAVRLANAVALPMVLKSALELNVIDALVSAGGFLSPPR
ncbi:hypothetical protein NL676_036682 [Syzygium grande]|nr:hypothetical protein NL676_036682 [Syzygium grande]